MGNVTTKARLHCYKATGRFIIEIRGACADANLFLKATDERLEYGERFPWVPVDYSSGSTFLNLVRGEKTSRSFEFISRDIVLNIPIEAGILYGKAEYIYDDTPNLLELVDLLKGNLSLELLIAESEWLIGKSTSSNAESWFPEKYSHLCCPNEVEDIGDCVNISCIGYSLDNIPLLIGELARSTGAFKRKSYYTKWTEFALEQEMKIFQEEVMKEAQKEEPTSLTYCALAEIRVKQSTFCYIVISDTDAPNTSQVLKDLTNNKLNFGLFISGLDCSINVDSIDSVVLKDVLKIPGQVTIKNILGEVDETVMPIFLQE